MNVFPGKQSEKAVQNSIFTYLVMRGALVLRINSGAVSAGEDNRRRFIRFVVWQLLGGFLQSVGVSDILACYKGRFMAIEVKAPGRVNNVSQAQDAFLAAVEQAGGVTLVADNLEQVQEVMDGLQ